MLAFGAQILAQILNVIYVTIAGHLLGKSIYGTFVYILSIYIFISSVTKFGFANSLIVYNSRKDISDEKKRWIASFAIKLSIVLCVFVSAFFFFVGDNASGIYGKVEMDRTIFLLTIPFLLFKTMIDVLSAIIRGKKDTKGYYMASLLLVNIMRVVLLPVVVYIFRVRSVYTLIYVYYISYICNIGYCIHHMRKHGYIGGTKEVYPWKEILRFTYPLMFTGMVHVLNKEIDSYIIGQCIDSGQVAIYNVANSVAVFSSFTLVAVNSIFAPMISELYHNNRIKELGNLYSLTTKWMLTVNVLIIGMVLVYSSDIMRIAGEEFAEGGSLLMIVIFGQLVNSGMGSVGFLNSMTGHGKCNLLSNIVSLFVNVMLNLLLISRYGVLGVGVATAVSLATNNFINFYFEHKYLGLVPYTKRFIAIPIVLLLCTPVLIGLKYLLADVFFIIRIGVAGVIYVITYSVLSYFLICDNDEKNTVKNFINKILGKISPRS